MKKLWVILLSIAVLLVSAACGGGSGTSGGQSTGTPGTGGSGTGGGSINLTGNWQYSTTSTTPAGRSLSIFGWFDQSGNSITATVHITANNACFPGQYIGGVQDVTVTGTANGNAVILNLSEFDGQLIKLTATASSSDALSGTYEIIGGCAGGEKGTLTAFKIPSITGKWAGTITVNGDTANVTADLVQGAPFHGLPSISGTATFSGSSSCFSGTGIIRGQPSDLMGGTYLFYRINVPVDSPTQQIQFSGTINSTATSMTGDIDVNFGTCNNQSGTATLQRQ